MCMNRESPTVSQHSEIHWESAPNGEKSQILLCIKVSTIQNQTRHPCEAQQSHEKRLNLWFGHESVADTLLLQMRTPASENEEWQRKKAKRHMWHPSPHLRSTACTHPASQRAKMNAALPTLSGPVMKICLRCELVTHATCRRHCSGTSAGPLHTFSQT